MRTGVVIVTWNGEIPLHKCLRSLKEIESTIDIYILDNASADETLARAKAVCPAAKITALPENLGFGRANNLGIAQALKDGCENILLLNQDAWIAPDCIAKLADALRKHPEFGLLSPLHLAGDGKGLDRLFASYLAKNYQCLTDFILADHSPDEVYELPFVNAAIWLVRSEVFRDIGGFCPLFPHYGEDVNFCDRLRYHNWKIGVMPSAQGYHERQQTNRPLTPKTAAIRLLVDLMNLNRSPNVPSRLWYILTASLRGFLRIPATVEGEPGAQGFSWQWQKHRYILQKLPLVKYHREITAQRGPHYLEDLPSQPGHLEV